MSYRKTYGKCRRLFMAASALAILIGLILIAGCGNGNLEDEQTSQAVMQRPADLDTLFRTNMCVSCDLSNWRLNYLDLSRSDLTGANLTNTNLMYSNLSNANLTSANLTHTDLSHASLAFANLTGADLTDADLSNANLAYANLTGATLDGALLNDANMMGAVWVDGHKCDLSSPPGQCTP